MDKNKLILAIILGLSLLSISLGIVTLSQSSSKAKYTKTTGAPVFREGTIGAALVTIHGAIQSGKSTYQETGADTILARLREIGNSTEIKGVLVEIDSPGGTVAASQEIYQELLHLRKTKKIVVSMKDVTASGGYYIASAADYIFAQPGTITGSIGVISVVPNLKNLLDKAGVKIKVYKEGKFKDSLSMFKDSTPEEDAQWQKTLNQSYRKFIEDVAKGRNKTVSNVEEMAEGKVYSGEEAFRNKMVDDLGGRREALKKLSELCQYEGDIPLFEEQESGFDKFFKALGMNLTSPLSRFMKWENHHMPLNPGIYAILPQYFKPGEFLR